MKRFIRGLLGFTLVAHLAFAVAVRHLVEIEPWASLAAIVALALLVPALLYRIRLALDDRPISPVRRFFERLYYAHWGACLASTFVFIASLPLAIAGVASVGALAVGAYAIALGVALYAVFVRTRWVRIKTIELPLTGLPAAFDGYRIAQLSDIHVGSLFPVDAVRRFVTAANSLGADMIALTGDYLTSGTKFHADVASVLSELTAKDGVFAVWGNHDNYGDREPLRSLLLERGVRLLENESTRIERAGSSVTLVGVEDVYTRRTDVEASYKGVDPKEIVIVLVHDPKVFPSIAARGAALVLTGHTHWGQIGIPFAQGHVNLAKRFFRYPGGLYHHENGAALYVHPGIGATGPPIRYGVAPEVTLFVLRRKDE